MYAADPCAGALLLTKTLGKEKLAGVYYPFPSEHEDIGIISPGRVDRSANAVRGRIENSIRVFVFLAPNGIREFNSRLACGGCWKFVIICVPADRKRRE